MASRAASVAAVAVEPFVQWSTQRQEETHDAVKRVGQALEAGDRYALGGALGSLSGELSARASDLADVLSAIEPRASATQRLRLAWRRYDDLASEAEGLAVAAASAGLDDEIAARVRGLLGRVSEAEREEREGWIDAYWVDLGVGD